MITQWSNGSAQLADRKPGLREEDARFEGRS